MLLAPQEALRHFAQVNPSYYNLVIMDIRMPHLNGFSLQSHEGDNSLSEYYLSQH